ncbi:MAG: acylphosphatase [Steroidobacteraceae bacterium]
MSERHVARCCYVSGRVQGVYFRASTRDQARRLNLLGHACNLDDGRVEVLVVGPTDGVDALIDWLGKGPPSARVDSVDVIEIEIDETPDGFHVR